MPFRLANYIAMHPHPHGIQSLDLRMVEKIIHCLHHCLRNFFVTTLQSIYSIK